MHITLIQCNGLESNKKFFEKKLSEKHFCQKNFYEKKQIWTKEIVWKFSKVFGHSKFVGKNLEWPFLAILNLYYQIFFDNFSVHINLILCNGLESNDICTFLDFYSKI